MDYQPTGQMSGPTPGQTPPMADQTTEPRHTGGIWYMLAALLVLVAVALWYFYAKRAPAPSVETSAVAGVTVPAPSSGNTTADISSDLNQVPDTSAALDADAAASAQTISGL